MIYKEFFGLLFLAFVGWVLLASSGGDRINRFWEPTGWAGNVVVSVSALATGPEGQKKVQKVFDHAEYGCRYITWRLFYQKTYDQWVAAHATTPESKTAAAAVKAPAVSAASAAQASPAAPDAKQGKSGVKQ